MTIKYWIEGPKASGKTTVLKSIANQMNNGRTVDDQFNYHQPVKIHHFGGQNDTLHGDVLQQLQVSPAPYLIDRGYLSSIIYGWVGSVQPDFTVERVFDHWQLMGWTQFEQNQFKLIIDHIKGNDGAYVVLYASNPMTLLQRAKARKSNMNQAELHELIQSNVMHQHWGKMLSDLYFDKYPIIVWDISRGVISNFLDNLAVLKKFYGYTSFKTFGWRRNELFTALKDNSADAQTPIDSVGVADITSDDYVHQMNNIKQLAQLEDINLQTLKLKEMSKRQVESAMRQYEQPIMHDLPSPDRTNHAVPQVSLDDLKRDVQAYRKNHQQPKDDHFDFPHADMTKDDD